MIPMLHFYYMPGCEACRDAEPHVDAFQRANWSRVNVIKRNVNGQREYEIRGRGVKKTPTYALANGNEVIKRHVGALAQAELEAFVFGDGR